MRYEKWEACARGRFFSYIFRIIHGASSLDSPKLITLSTSCLALSARRVMIKLTSYPTSPIQVRMILFFVESCLSSTARLFELNLSEPTHHCTHDTVFETRAAPRPLSSSMCQCCLRLIRRARGCTGNAVGYDESEAYLKIGISSTGRLYPP